MKNLILKLKAILKDQRGAFISTLMMLIIPVMILGLVALTENTNTLRGSNTTLQNAVTVVSRHTAMMINPVSQSKGDPLISHKRSFNMLLDELNYTLGQDVENSTLDNVKYWMIVYNGGHTYKGYVFDYDNFTNGEVEKDYNDGSDSLDEILSYALYSNVESNVFSNDITGFPRTFYIADDGIHDTNVKGSIKVTVNNPGVLLVLNADIRSLMVEAKENATRWAYAKIVRK